jgi:D-alanyl-lipoteichoic acid acyltransferase DltB (MBOAT superfamily)
MEEATDGCRQILWGLFKKVLISDALGEVVDTAFAIPQRYSGGSLAAATVAFGIQIYCDFSGYSDVALGTAKLFGFRLRRNFAYPYFSRSPVEFWRRWHISLSTWFRDYLFIPMGGSRVGPVRLFVNVAITFLLSGLWHGAKWTFIAWGALHALGVYPFLLLRHPAPASPKEAPEGMTLSGLAGMILTFAFVSLAWVFFRARTVSDALFIWARMAGLAAAPELQPLPLSLPEPGLPVLVVGLFLLEWRERRHEHPLRLEGSPRWLRWAAYTTMIWGALLLGTAESRPFIYFQF